MRLHPLLREYAAERLRAFGPAVEEPLGDAALAYWIVFARANEYQRGRDVEHLDALEAEADGLMGALAWAHAHARHRQVLALTRVLNLAWDLRGRRENELRMLTWADEAARIAGDLRDQNFTAHGLAVTYLHLGRVGEARQHFERALNLARDMESPSDERDEVHSLAVLDAQTGHLAEARAGYERALALARELGDPRAERAEVHALAVLAFTEGRLTEARAYDEQALEIARRLGDPAAEAACLINLGDTIRNLRDYAIARQLIQEGLEISQRLGDTYMIGKSYEFLARLDRDEDRAGDAITHYREALRCFERVQSPDAQEVRAALRRLGVEA